MYARTIFSEPKFLGCVDNQIVLSMVLRYARLVSARQFRCYDMTAKRTMGRRKGKGRLFPSSHLPHPQRAFLVHIKLGNKKRRRETRRVRFLYVSQCEDYLL